MKKLKFKTPNSKIETDRIYLQRHEIKLAEIMFKYVDKDRKRLRKYLPWVDDIKSVNEEINFIKGSRRDWKKYHLFEFGIFRKSDNIYMGNISVHNIKWNYHSCELGYWILGDFEGQGYMTEAVLALESEMFKLKFNRVEIRCDELNQRSANVPLACGYKHEGTIRQNEINNLGKFRSTMIFGKLRKEHDK